MSTWLESLEKYKMLKWKQGNEILCMLCILTQHATFSLYEKLVGCFLVVKSFRVAAAFIKRRAAVVTMGWDDKGNIVPLTTMMEGMTTRVHQKDLMRDK